MFCGRPEAGPLANFIVSPIIESAFGLCEAATVTLVAVAGGLRKKFVLWSVTDPCVAGTVSRPPSNGKAGATSITMFEMTEPSFMMTGNSMIDAPDGCAGWSRVPGAWIFCAAGLTSDGVVGCSGTYCSAISCVVACPVCETRLTWQSIMSSDATPSDHLSFGMTLKSKPDVGLTTAVVKDDVAAGTVVATVRVSSVSAWMCQMNIS